MKRSILYVMAGAAMLLTVAACSEETALTQMDEPTANGGGSDTEPQTVTGRIKAFEPSAATRTELSSDNGTTAATWKNGDRIGIFPAEGQQVYYTVTDVTANKMEAIFNGHGWRLKSGVKYAAYYPFLADYKKTLTSIPVSFEGEKKDGDGNVTHLSAFDFMMSESKTPDNKNEVDFTFVHIGSLLQIPVTLNSGESVSSVTISAGDNTTFVKEMTVDLSKQTTTYNDQDKVSSLTITEVEAKDGKVYVMIPPTNLSNMNVTAEVAVTGGSPHTVTFTGSNYTKNSTATITNSQDTKDYEITTETGDTNKTTIKVNVAGSLDSSALSQYNEITVTGTLNSEDIAALKEWASTTTADGQAKTLDLSGATIGSIPANAFEGCTSLTSITIPSGTTIGDSAFKGCTGLTSVTLSEGVTSIGSGAFEGCSSLASIEIPASVTSIGDSAFLHCTSLTGVSISTGVTSIGASAFGGCSSLTSISIPASVTSIGEKAFKGCSALTDVTIPESVTTIGEAAFYACVSLTNVIIPSSVSSVGDFAFKDCSGLTSVTLSEGLTSIGSSSFESCSSLSSVTIPSSVTSIGDSAFKGCSSLSAVTCEAEATTGEDGNWATPSVGTDAFTDIKQGAILYVPVTSKSTYESSSWGTYFKNSDNTYNIKPITEDVTFDGTITDQFKTE